MQHSRTRVRFALALVAVLALSGSGCYYKIAREAMLSGGPTPWFCNPTAPGDVTGPGMGTIDFYEGIERGPLDPTSCKNLGAQFDLAKAYAMQYPTAADAEAAGFARTFHYIAGMGTHHGLGGLTPELLADPSFDRFNPIIPGSIMDDRFDLRQPEFLQYNGNDPDDVLVGMSWYVRTDTGRPPEGFSGLNDWWHHHPILCASRATAEIIGVNTTEAVCSSRAGVNVYMDDYYMLHAWLVDDLEYYADVYAPMHPCIKSSGAIFDMDDPCHDEALTRTADGGSPAFCPIGRIEEQFA
jgi:hypothetical protein